jgi:ATP-dependent Clp protease ATP-binding subunit ClpB
VRAAVSRIVNDTAPKTMSKTRFIELEVGALCATGKGKDEIDARFKRVVEKLSSDTVLVVPNLDTLVGSSGAADILRGVMTKGHVRVLALTTISGQKKLADKDPGFLREFSQVDIEPSTIEQTKEVLRGIATRYEKHHQVKIGENAIAASVRLAKRYLQQRALPGAAVDLLDEAASRKRIEMSSLPTEVDNAVHRLVSLESQKKSLSDDTEDPAAVKVLKGLDAEIEKLNAFLEAHEAVENNDNVVNEEHVAAVLHDWTGIGTNRLVESEVDQLKRMEDTFRERIVGQDEAVAAISQAVRRAKMGLRDPKKPIASYLFLGSSGVGKTLIAKSLAEILFGTNEAMLRLDMSEYRESHQAQKLIGAPPGYKNAEDGGILVEWIKKRPQSLVLFDEIEKSVGPEAGGAVSDLLLGILDDARLTDGRGFTANFSEAVIIMTSNIGTKRLLEADPAMFDTEEGRKKLSDILLKEELSRYLRPEFVNRIDNVIVFRPLLKDTLLKVADIELRYLDKLLEPREMKMRVSDAVKEFLVEDEANKAFGARPLKRSIVKNLQTPLTNELLNGNYKEGDIIAADYVDGKFVFTKQATPV